MMPNIYIIYRAMFDQSGTMHTIGGIENYILSLCDVFTRQGWPCHIVQPAKKAFTLTTPQYTVHSVTTGLYRGNLKKIALANWVSKNADKNNDIIIFATDSYSVKMPDYKTLAIQHGISWDKPRAAKSAISQYCSSLLSQYKYLSYIKSDCSLVCVDHNFVNWYRTWFNIEQQHMKVIYNFYSEKISESEFAKKWSDDNATLNIIIARRFVDYRGIKLIAPIIKQLLPQYNIQVSFAGDGPLKPYLTELFANEAKVKLMQYGPNESFSVHKSQHIAIIPTLGSEGTSLSMIEAMAAGCMVISSNVGGLSNLIINGFNGRLVMPNTAEFTQALTTSLNDYQQSKMLAYNGLTSIAQVCSKENWAQDWIGMIKHKQG
ncbi:glycosyltransferase family 4 protein [Pseudoalteromonas translucida]|nr:glycosyltransferase family 4 protein [Pseudoalteromonas translucida]